MPAAAEVDGRVGGSTGLGIAVITGCCQCAAVGASRAEQAEANEMETSLFFLWL